MDEKKEIVQALEKQLSEVRQEISDLSKKLSDIRIELSFSSTSAEWNEYDKAKQDLVNALDDKGKEVLSTRKKLEKKIKTTKILAGVFFAIYCLVAAGIIYALSITSIITYVITLAVGMVLGLIFFIVAPIPYKRKHTATYGDPYIKEYDKKYIELYNDFSNKRRNKLDYIQELRNQEIDITRKINQNKEIESSILFEIEELDFNFMYKDTILFYGKEKGNYYNLYLDSHLYDTVKGHKIVKIMLTPGLHSFKVDNTSYNIDGSVIYSYEFNTRQIVAGEKIEAYPMVCEYNKIRQVSGKEFQKITKTELI